LVNSENFRPETVSSCDVLQIDSLIPVQSFNSAPLRSAGVDDSRLDFSWADRVGMSRRWNVILSDLPERLARPAPRSGAYQPEFDGLRFVAIAIVVIGHLAERVERFRQPSAPGHGFESAILHLLAVPGPGVLLFFAISGFVITHQFVASGRSPLDPYVLRGYFARRALRIEPPYLLLLSATFVAISVLGLLPANVRQFHHDPNSLPVSYLVSLFYAHGILFGTYPRLFAPGWTLEVEVQFYLIAPLICQLYLLKKDVQARRLVFSAVFLAALVLAFVCRPEVVGGNWHFSIFRFAVFFVVGSGFALFRADLGSLVRAFPPWLAAAVPWFGLALLLLPDAFWPGSRGDNVRTLCQVAAVALLFVGVQVERSALRRICLGGWPRLLGAACYSLYLTHLQVLHVGAWALSQIVSSESLLLAFLVDAVILLPVALGIGLAFYVLIERPFMHGDLSLRTLRVIFRKASTPSPGRLR
jgi:peptidoglycan/LPS O-acetylase OafA/YrhL